MSSTSPRFSRSKSPQPSSPKSSKSSAERRRPLHQRSDSETNIISSSGSDLPRVSQDSTSSKDLFPRLPSQILLPKQAPYIFEDDTATAGISENASPADWQSQHPSRPTEPSLRRRDVKGKGKADPPPDQSRVSPTFQTPPGPKPVLSLADRFKQRYRGEGQVARLRSSFESLEGPPKFPQSETEASPAAPESVVEAESVDSPPEPIPRRRRRRSSASRASRAELKELAESPAKAPERPRSASTPVAPTDAFLEALIANGGTVQYPELRKPSMHSLKSQSSSTRMAYPPPLRLNRKAGNSRLNVAAAAAGERQYDWRQGGGRLQRENDIASMPLNQNPVNTTHSGHWANELDDKVAELNLSLPRRQRSMYQRDSVPERMRSSSFSSSHSSQNGSRFFNFGNDSKTAWAR